MNDDTGEINIDKLLEEAFEKTKKMEEEMDKKGESVMKKFTLDDIQEFSVYDFEGSWC